MTPGVRVLALLGVAAVTLAGGCQNAAREQAARAELDARMAFGGPSDVDFAAALWASLIKAKLAGPGAMRTHRYPGTAPHGAELQRVDGLLNVNGRINPVLVLHNYQPGGVLQTVEVMLRRPGYQPAARDWYWAVFLPDGSPARNADDIQLAGKIGGCDGCHRAAPGGDRVFGHNRYR